MFDRDFRQDLYKSLASLWRGYLDLPAAAIPAMIPLTRSVFFGSMAEAIMGAYGGDGADTTVPAGGLRGMVSGSQAGVKLTNQTDPAPTLLTCAVSTHLQERQRGKARSFWGHDDKGVAQASTVFGNQVDQLCMHRAAFDLWATYQNNASTRHP